LVKLLVAHQQQRLFIIKNNETLLDCSRQFHDADLIPSATAFMQLLFCGARQLFDNE